MLSNIAIPRYYGAFRAAVIRGEIPVNREISMEMNRIDGLIENPGIYYDPEPVEGWIRFCENELTLTDGSPLHLLDTFKLWGEQIFGWYYFVERPVYQPGPKGTGDFVRKRIKKRLINKQYLIVGRGAAKSLYDSCLHSYYNVIIRKTTHSLAIAPTMRQADETLAPIRTAISRARGPLFKVLTMGSIHNTTGDRSNRQQLASTKKGIQNFLTNSLIEVQPMSIDKLQGFRGNFATVDEWLSGDVKEDISTALEQSCSKNDDWLIVYTSSEGTVRNGSGDTIKMELMRILKGEYINEHVSIWWYKLDDIKEVSNPAMWPKANPNLDRTVTYETYQQDVIRAEQSPYTRNDILAKRFGIPAEGYTYYFTYEETGLHPSREFWQMPCSLGLDLSLGDDFCAASFLFPLRNELYGIKARCYITSRTYDMLQPSLKEKYKEFIEEGSLVVMEGVNLDMMDVYDELQGFIEHNKYNVLSVGYDPYNARDFIERWGRENGFYAVEKVPQGARTESVPLGEIKKLAEARLLLFDQSIMKFCLGNCIVITDTNGNKKLMKKRHSEKIDAVAALLDAYVSFKLHKEEFM